MRVCAAALVVAALLAAAAPAPAQAGDPIMPLAEVHGGMHCTGYSVVQGTAISSFDVDVTDVVDGQPGDDARILVHVSGPAVDATGIGPGFSGSPIYCLDGQGVARNIGAISETIGDYGGHTVLVTPIEQILGASTDPPPPTVRARPRLLRSARPMASPMTISGVSPALGQVLAARARRSGHTLIAVPAGPLGSFPVQQLRPGASVSIGYSSGDVALGALGTVAYVDGDKVWAFGHSLDSVGPRSLILQDAYIYSIVNNPVALGDAITYKLGAPGHDVGILTNDTLDAVAGHVGPAPPETTMRVLARNLDNGHVALTQDKIADETALNLPTGSSPLSLVAPTVLAQAGADIAQASPVQQSGSMCLRIRVRELRKPMGFCNRYVATGGSGGSGDTSAAGGAATASMIEDLSSALGVLDSYRLGLVHTTSVSASVRLANGLREAFLIGARAPRSARRGTTISVGLIVRPPRGARRRVVIHVRVPIGTRRGERDLVISGSPEDAPGGDLGNLLGDLTSPTIELDLGPPEGADNGPSSLAAVAQSIAGLQRYDGLRARFVAPGGHAGSSDDPASEGRRVYRHPTLRLTGRVRVPIRITTGSRRSRH